MENYNLFQQTAVQKNAIQEEKRNCTQLKDCLLITQFFKYKKFAIALYYKIYPIQRDIFGFSRLQSLLHDPKPLGTLNHFLNEVLERTPVIH